MPWMNIHRTKDGKWHTPDCDLLNADTLTGEYQAIGSMAVKPDPPKDQMCRKCWWFLFGDNAEADRPKNEVRSS